MTRRLAPLAVIAAVLAGCGGHATTAPKTQQLQAYFFRGPALVPVSVTVPETAAVGTAALGGLLAGPPAGYGTTLPAGVRLEKLTIANGVATAYFSPGVDRLPRTAQGQIVYTLTQFPTVDAVVALTGSQPIALQDGYGRVLRRPATRVDFVDLTTQALIFVASPIRDSIVTSPVHANGTADTFEATFQADSYAGDTLIDQQTVDATSGSGVRGTWRATFDLPSGDDTIVFYEFSAENGQPIHETRVHLHVR